MMRIDLNSDLGESFGPWAMGDDPAMLDIVTSANVAAAVVSTFVDEAGFFYAPDPSSQLACAIGGNIGMNSGGAHCLKYGVTTNNLLGVTMVLMDGSIVELGGPMGEGAGLDLLGVVCGAEGQLGIVTEATLRILPKPAGARPVLIGFDSSETAGACVAAIVCTVSCSQSTSPSRSPPCAATTATTCCTSRATQTTSRRCSSSRTWPEQVLSPR